MLNLILMILGFCVFLFMILNERLNAKELVSLTLIAGILIMFAAAV